MAVACLEGRAGRKHTDSPTSMVSERHVLKTFHFSSRLGSPSETVTSNTLSSPTRSLWYLLQRPRYLPFTQPILCIPNETILYRLLPDLFNAFHHRVFRQGSFIIFASGANFCVHVFLFLLNPTANVHACLCDDRKTPDMYS